MVVISPFCGRMIATVGSRLLMTAGMAAAAAGLLVLTQIDPATSYGLLLAGYLLFGISLGLVYAPMSTAAMAAMPRAKVGIACGVLAMDRIVAGALGLAATGAVFHTLWAMATASPRRSPARPGSWSRWRRWARCSAGRSCATPNRPGPTPPWPASRRPEETPSPPPPPQIPPLSERFA